MIGWQKSSPYGNNTLSVDLFPASRCMACDTSLFRGNHCSASNNNETR